MKKVNFFYVYETVTFVNKIKYLIIFATRFVKLHYLLRIVMNNFSLSRICFLFLLNMDNSELLNLN